MLNSETFANTLSGSTTLSAGITNTATSLTVVSAASFPTVPQFRARCDNEIMLVGGVSGTTFSSLTRGLEGTTAAAHSSGANISHIVTSGSIIQSALARARFPASGGFTIPDLSSYGWQNQGLATLTTGAQGHPMFYAPQESGLIHHYVRTLPSTPYTLTSYIQSTIPAVEYFMVGLGWYDTVSTKSQFFYTRWHSTYPTAQCAVMFNLLSDPHTFSTQWTISPVPYADPWLRINDDGTNLNTSISRDGINFVPIFSRGRTADFTPNRVGLIFHSNNSSYPLNFTVISLNQT